MNNKTNILKIVGGIAVLAVIAFVFVNISKNGNLDAFAQTYADYRNQQYDTYIYSYVPVVDASSETGEANFFTYLAKALDTSQTNNHRYENAQLALDTYDTTNQKALDNFSEHISSLDSATSRLVEAANQIDDDEYRETATEIAGYAREIQQNYRSLRLKYIERFNLQTEILEELVGNGGNILATENTLRKGGPRVPVIGEEIQTIMEETNNTSQKMDDLYLSLKGRAGLGDYPTQFTENE